MQKKREKWVDDVKIFACILVALGHFFQSMVRSDILTETILYTWFIDTIYYFHVPLFFLCSGYLYQRKSNTGVEPWCTRVYRKAISLGIPYLVFSFATWLLKEAFSGSINTQNDGLVEMLLFSPASPYWYLYTLFFIFLITPSFRDDKSCAVWWIAAICFKVLRSYSFIETGIYALDSVMDNMVWFASGMMFSSLHSKQMLERIRLVTRVSVFLAFLGTSMIISVKDLPWEFIPLTMGIWGGVGTLLIICNWNVKSKIRGLMDWLAGYTMPIFLMHTIFAAGIRAVLMKVGVFSPVLHVMIGIVISFAGPIMAAVVMEKTKLDFVIYPTKYMNKSKGQ